MRVNVMNKKKLEMPKFKSESEEADWWASRAGRQYVKQKSAEAQSQGTKAGGSSLVAKLNQKSSIQIAIRLPEADIVQARKLAQRKGLGYQTLLKMLVHEGLAREARRS
jgi:predicted DNA binding CopG/RHH family protein